MLVLYQVPPIDPKACGFRRRFFPGQARGILRSSQEASQHGEIPAENVWASACSALGFSKRSSCLEGRTPGWEGQGSSGQRSGEMIRQSPHRGLGIQVGKPFPVPHLSFLVCTVGVRLECDSPALGHTEGSDDLRVCGGYNANPSS